MCQGSRANGITDGLERPQMSHVSWLSLHAMLLMNTYSVSVALCFPQGQLLVFRGPGPLAYPWHDWQQCHTLFGVLSPGITLQKPACQVSWFLSTWCRMQGHLLD